MSSDPSFVRFDQVVVVLRQLTREQRVGTLYITTADNRLASISLLGGEIVGVSYRVLRGRDALLLIKGIGLSQYAIHDGKVLDTDADLPPTHEILAFLGAPVETPKPAAHPAAHPEAGPEARKIQQILETELIEYLGPMARIVCREHVEKASSLANAADLSRLVDDLAREISDRKQAEDFKRASWTKLPGPR